MCKSIEIPTLSLKKTLTYEGFFHEGNRMLFMYPDNQECLRDIFVYGR
jgi:hypothetical protein